MLIAFNIAFVEIYIVAINYCYCCQLCRLILIVILHVIDVGVNID